MANITYPPFSAIKEVYLPIDGNGSDDGTTLEQYKNKYGIDLDEFFKITLENGAILLHCPRFTKLFLVNTDEVVANTGMASVLIPNTTGVTLWDEGASDGETVIAFNDTNGDSVIGIRFFIADSDEFIKENIKIYVVVS